VTISVLSGVAFFLLFGALVILTLSGALSAMVINGQNQRTIRRQNEMQYQIWVQQQAAPQVAVVDPPQLPYSDPAPAMQLPQSSSFVPAVPRPNERLVMSCVEFVTALFDDNGTPNPRRILGPHTKRPGQIQ